MYPYGCVRASWGRHNERQSSGRLCQVLTGDQYHIQTIIVVYGAVYGHHATRRQDKSPSKSYWFIKTNEIVPQL